MAFDVERLYVVVMVKGQRKMGHSYTNLQYHIVFSTKNRQPLIKPELQSKLWPYLGGIVRGLNGKALVVNGMPDHVHMLISLPPVLAISDVVRTVKANASKWVHETDSRWRRFAWQAGYAAFSVSASAIDSVADYIRNQENHHRKLTFEEEFIRLLTKHGIEYDDRYLWR